METLHHQIAAQIAEHANDPQRVFSLVAIALQAAPAIAAAADIETLLKSHRHIAAARANIEGEAIELAIYSTATPDALAETFTIAGLSWHRVDDDPAQDEDHESALFEIAWHRQPVRVFTSHPRQTATGTAPPIGLYHEMESV